MGSWFPSQGSNPRPLHCAHRVLTTGPSGKSPFLFFKVSAGHSILWYNFLYKIKFNLPNFLLKLPFPECLGTSPVVKTPPSNAGGPGSIPDQGTKIPYAVGWSQNFLKFCLTKFLHLLFFNVLPRLTRAILRWLRTVLSKSVSSLQSLNLFQFENRIWFSFFLAPLYVQEVQNATVFSQTSKVISAQ